VADGRPGPSISISHEGSVEDRRSNCDEDLHPGIYYVYVLIKTDPAPSGNPVVEGYTARGGNRNNIDLL